MKVFKYFINLSEIHEDDYPAINPISNIEINDITYNLYAFTNNKEFAKEFEDIRNMKLFVKITTDMTKKDYEDYCNLYSHANLSKYSFVSAVSMYGPEKVSVICTMAESDIVGNLYITVMDNISELIEELLGYGFLGDYNETIDFNNIFTDEIKYALDILGFSSLITDYSTVGELPFPIYDLAEFDYFINKFYNTFNCDRYII